MTTKITTDRNTLAILFRKKAEVPACSASTRPKNGRRYCREIRSLSFTAAASPEDETTVPHIIIEKTEKANTEKDFTPRKECIRSISGANRNTERGRGSIESAPPQL
ncbi:MAG: hypothetical protein Q7R35_12335 [Elusimicrobiota bacterium]|nr:hypothetical protein [Elusimicrobiota bacterium]